MALIQCRECKANISSNAVACPQCGASQKKKTSLPVKILFAAIFAPMLLTIFNSKTNPSQIDSVAPAAPAAKTQTELDDLAFDFEWGKAGFGNIMTITGTVKNSGITAVKDVVIQCESSGPSGTLIDKNKRVLYEIVPVGKSVKFKEFNMGFLHTQAASTSCSIIGFARP